jgi:hypothetical protein
MAMQSVKVPPRSMEIWIFFEGEEEEAMALGIRQTDTVSDISISSSLGQEAEKHTAARAGGACTKANEAKWRKVGTGRR